MNVVVKFNNSGNNALNIIQKWLVRLNLYMKIENIKFHDKERNMFGMVLCSMAGYLLLATFRIEITRDI